MKKIIIIIAFLALIAPVLSNAKQDWKTYANKEVGISFEYPAKYRMSEQLTDYSNIATTSPLKNSKGKKIWVSFTDPKTYQGFSFVAYSKDYEGWLEEAPDDERMGCSSPFHFDQYGNGCDNIITGGKKIVLKNEWRDMECSPGLTTAAYLQNPNNSTYARLEFSANITSVQSYLNKNYSCVDDKQATRATKAVRSWSINILNGKRLSSGDEKQLAEFRKILASIKLTSVKTNLSKTYTNAKHGLSYKYPNKWKIKLDTDNSEGHINESQLNPPNYYTCLNEHKSGVGEIACGSVLFGIILNPKKLTLEKFLQDEFGWDYPGAYRDMKKISVAGKTAYKFIASSAFDGSDSKQFWLVLNDQTLFSMSGAYISSEDDKIMEAVFNSITVKQPKTIKLKQSTEIISLNNVWNKYINYNLGFSINIPRKMFHSFGACIAPTKDDNSYRPKMIDVPTKIFASKDSVYISSEYFYALNGETRQGTEKDGYTYSYSKCDKVNNSLTVLNDKEESYYAQFWKIDSKIVKNNSELDKFIKNRYGSGCSLGAKKKTEQKGVYDVLIKSDNKPLETTKCPVNYITVIKYSPSQHKVVSWDIGQSYSFYKKADASDAYDEDMLKSFRFLK